MKRLKTRNGNLKAAPIKQQGAILIFCLVFMAVLTLLGVSGMESTVLEERMAGNMRDYSLAFQAAESALQDGENWLNQQVVLPLQSGDGSTRVWAENSMDPSASDTNYWWDDPELTDAWWDNNADELDGFDNLATQPQYIIEEYHTATSGQSIAIGNGETTMQRVFHRITARGVGITSSSEVFLQSTFVKPYE